MIRENLRPLLAFALVATMCAFTIAQGVRSEALQGFVAAQVPQVVVAGAQLMPQRETDPEPTSSPGPRSPVAPVEVAPGPGTASKAPRVPSSAGDSDRDDDGRPPQARGRDRAAQASGQPSTEVPEKHRQSERKNRRDAARPHDRDRVPGHDAKRDESPGNSAGKATGPPKGGPSQGEAKGKDKGKDKDKD